MRRSTSPFTSRDLRMLSVLLASSGLLSGCEMPEPGQVGDGRDELIAGESLQETPADWQSHSLATTNLVTPRWSPTGDRILARGTKGVGLYVVSATGGIVLYAEENYHGDAVFTSDGSLCKGTTEHARIVRFDQESGQGIETDTPCEVASIDERLGERVHRGPKGDVFHNAYLGTVTIVGQDGREEQIEGRGAWNVAVSPDGRRIAWSLGTLVTPELFVYDAWAGVSSLGRGAHPTWSPDGRFLVYTVPDIADHQGGGHSYRADLDVYDADLSRTAPLFRTSSVAEMQPVFSPDGRSIAFADWDSGVITIAPFEGAGSSEVQP